MPCLTLFITPGADLERTAARLKAWDPAAVVKSFLDLPEPPGMPAWRAYAQAAHDMAQAAWREGINRYLVWPMKRDLTGDPALDMAFTMSPMYDASEAYVLMPDDSWKCIKHRDFQPPGSAPPFPA